MMQKLATIVLVFIFSCFTATAAMADGRWEMSLEGASNTGFFDYVLHYNTDTSQVLSEVIVPQNQYMVILNGRYYPKDGDVFVNLQYGDTGLGWQGRGSDSDWTIPGSNTLTYYGNMDSYGSQKMFMIDIGVTVLESAGQKITAAAGWGRQETGNELRNVVYHLINGVDVGNRTQPDNGSYLNGEFTGFHIEAADDIRVNSNLSVNLSFTLFQINAKAYGHWSNHIPAWDWVDSGSTIGYKVKLGLAYAFLPNFRGRLGYYYHYLEAANCVEVLNGSTLGNAVDLIYQQTGLYFGVNYLF